MRFAASLSLLPLLVLGACDRTRQATPDPVDPCPEGAANTWLPFNAEGSPGTLDPNAALRDSYWTGDGMLVIDRSREALRLLQSSAVSTVGGFQMCEEVTETPPPSAVAGRDWWLVTIAHAEALCGEEDVYGKLCEEACVTTTDRPYWLEGVVLRVTPLQLTTPLAQSTAVALDRTHLRSLLASAYFADEARRAGR